MSLLEHTDVLIVRSQGPLTHRVLVIPGNPGVVHFYDAFCHALADANPGTDVICVSHKGHTKEGDTDGRLFSLNDQVDHKFALVDALTKGDDPFNGDITPGNVPLVLMGHSIGAYICLMLADKWPDVRVVALCPTFRNLYDGLKWPVKVAIQPGFRHLIATLLHVAPSGLARFLMNLSSGMTDEAKYATADMLRYDFVHNLLFMAHTESLDVIEVNATVERVFERAKELENVMLVYSHIDDYTPKHFVRQLEERHPHLQKHIFWADKDVRHAFVLESSDKVAKQVSELMKRWEY